MLQQTQTQHITPIKLINRKLIDFIGQNSLVCSMGKNSTCLVCLIRTNYNIFERCFPIQGYCEHSKTQFSSKPRFRLNRRLYILNIVLCLAFFIPLSSYLSILPTICRSDGFMCLIFSIDALNLSLSVLMSVCLFFVMKVQKLEMNCWSYIFQNPEVYNLDKILLSSEIKKIQFKKFFDFVLILIANIFIGVLCFYFPYDVFSGQALRRPSIFLCYSFQCYMVFELVQRINIIKYVLDAFTRSLILNDETLTVDRAQKYCKLILVINSNVKLSMVFMSMMVFLWISQSTIGLIFNIFVTIRLYDYDLGSLTTLETRCVATILEIIILLVIAEESVNKKVRFIQIIFALNTNNFFLKNTIFNFELFFFQKLLIYLVTTESIIVIT